MRLPKISPVHLDAAAVAIGILCLSAAAGGVDWRAGLATFGGLLLGAELVTAVLERRRPG